MYDYYIIFRLSAKTKRSERDRRRDNIKTIVIQKFHHAPLSFTGRQYIYLNCPPMSTSAAVHLAPEPHNQVMRSNTGPFEAIEVSPTSATIIGGRIRNTFSVDRTTLAPLVRIAEQQYEFIRNHRVNKGGVKNNEGGGQNTAVGLAETLPGYAMDFIVHHVGKGDNVR